MTAPLEIALVWSASDRTLDLASDAAGGRVTLDDAVAQSIIERASQLPGTTPVRITVAVPADALATASDLSAAIRGCFARRRETAAYQLRTTMRAGWVSLLMGGGLLVVLISVAEVIRRLTIEGRLATVLQEGLMIVGWVALWRPVEVLLYDRWLRKRDLALLRRLALTDVHLLELERGRPDTDAAGPPAASGTP